jgi:hypothetical protein
MPWHQYLAEPAAAKLIKKLRDLDVPDCENIDRRTLNSFGLRYKAMTKQELRDLLANRSDLDFVRRDVFGRRPWIFDSDESYNLWRETIASELRLDGNNILVVGSAATGFSLSPLKPGRPFRSLNDPSGGASDVDMVILNENLFTRAWDIIVSFDRGRRLGFGEDSRAKIRLDVYWGLVATWSIPENTDPARSVLTALSTAGRIPPIRGHMITCRLYRRREDLEAYHVNSMRLLRLELSK